MAPSGYTAHPAPMALNGSNFGAASSLDDHDRDDKLEKGSPGIGYDYEYDEKYGHAQLAPPGTTATGGAGAGVPPVPTLAYGAAPAPVIGRRHSDDDEFTSSFPPVVQPSHTGSMVGVGYGSGSDSGSEEGRHGQGRGYAGQYR